MKCRRWYDERASDVGNYVSSVTKKSKVYKAGILLLLFYESPHARFCVEWGHDFHARNTPLCLNDS